MTTQHNTDSGAMLAPPITAEPPLYAIIMHNDDYTTMDFVVWVLQYELGLNETQAYQIMLDIHYEGQAVVARLPKEIAEMKAQSIRLLAEREEFPLLVTLESS